MTFQHKFDPTSLREYDIRGIVGKTLSGDDAFAIGRCFGTIVKREGGSVVAVGYDGRLSSTMLEEALVKGLTACGLKVLRVGCCPTPMLYYGAYELKADGGVMVTGSHNPPDYNGFKMVLKNKPFFGAQIQQIGTMAAAGDVVEEAQGSSETVDIADQYVARMMQDYDGGDRELTVVWDPGNGSGGVITEKLAKVLSGKHIVINAEIDGRFPNHHPDPTVPKNLEQIIAEGLGVHGIEPGRDRREMVSAIMAEVGLDPAMMHRYPHEFSGGQRQRIAIARAMILNPRLVVLDEPTSALDMTVQVQIVELLRGLQRKHGLAFLFISHDLRVVRAMSHQIMVMRAGEVVEQGTTAEVFDAPKSDYTRRLIEAAFLTKLA